MSEQFKPLADQVSERMVNLLNDNRSIFTKPQKEDGSSQFLLPVNARSKQKYTGPAALILIMQNRRDPRWLSFDKALYNKTPVKKGAYGTLIEFNSTSELRPKTENGQPVLNKEGKQKMERVKIDEPVRTQAWLYNGKDLVGLKPMKMKAVSMAPMDRAQAILDHSGIKMEQEGLVTTTPFKLPAKARLPNRNCIMPLPCMNWRTLPSTKAGSTGRKPIGRNLINWSAKNCARILLLS